MYADILEFIFPLCFLSVQNNADFQPGLQKGIPAAHVVLSIYLIIFVCFQE